MKKMSLVLIALLLVFSVILGACSEKTPDPAPSSSETPETPVKEEQTNSDESPANKQYKGEIVISLDSASIEGFESLQEAYKKVQPDVKLIWEPKGGPGVDYTSILGTMLASGTPRPDIVAGAYMPTYNKYLNFDRYRYQTNPYTGNQWDEDLDWNFWVGKNAGGARSVLATQSVHIMWFYNKDIFNKLGLTPPTTWSEMVRVAEKINEAGIIPIASSYGYKVPLWMNEIYMDQFTRKWHDIVRAQPGDYNFDDEIDGKFVADPNDPFLNSKYNFNQARFYKGIKDGTIRFDTPEVAELVKNMAMLFPKYAQKDFFVASDEYQLFLQQKAAMIIDGTWTLPTLTKDMANLNDPKRLEELQIKDSGALQSFEWGTFENPAMEGPLVQGPVRSVESATGEYISIIDKNQEQSDMVLDFVMFWLSKPGYQAWIDGQVKANKFTPGGPIMVKGVEVPADIKAQFDNVKMLGNAEIVMNNLLLTRVADLDTGNFTLFKEALEGKITPEEFGTKLQKTWTDNLNEIVKQAGLTADNIENPARAPGK